MPVSSAPSTSKRLLALLSLLQSRRDWPARVLAQRLDVSERTVRRDIDRLRELDYAIDATRGPDGGYRLAAGAKLPPLLFDDDQVIAIAIALQTAGSLGAGIEGDAQRALATLRQFLPDHLSQRIESLAVAAAPTWPIAPTVDPAVLLRIGDAIRATRELRFDYGQTTKDSRLNELPVRRTEPHELLLHRGHWYLLGYSSERDDWRTYRVDRIAPRSHTGRSFSRRPVPGGDPAGFLRALFKGADDGTDVWPCRGTATLHAPVEGIDPYVEDGTVHALTPDLSRVELGAWSWGALAASFARFEAEITHVDPPELRDAFAELSARARDAAVRA